MVIRTPGTMGIAIMSGIMSTLEEMNNGQTTHLHTPASSVPVTPLDERLPQYPSRFIACVRRQQSGARIKKAVAAFSTPCDVMIGDNVKAVQEGDVVLLGCKPQMFRDIVCQEGMKEALSGKLVISILAGVTAEQIAGALYPAGEQQTDSLPPCRIVRAMPNTASMVRESMTVIATTTPPLPAADTSLVNWMFSRIGRTVTLPPSAMDASTALCGSGPAFMALVLEALSDGGVAMGLPRQEAQLMAAQVMMGTAELVVKGEHPAILRDKVSTPGGCTIGGLLVLEEGRVRGAVARAVREATVVASQLGQGVAGVNGTRHIEHRRMFD